MIFGRIALPAGRGILATVAMLTFVANWNNFFLPFLMEARDDLMPLPVGLGNMAAQTTLGSQASSAAGSDISIMDVITGAFLVAVPIVVLFILAGLAFGLDPVTQFYTWLAGISTVGIIILLIATSVAVLAFFARRQRAGDLDVPIWRAFIAPGLGFVALAGVLFLVFQNLPDLVGGSTPIAIGVVVLLVAVFAVGAGIAAKRSEVTLE